MANCRKCNKKIDSKYIFCHSCNQKSKTYKAQNGYIKFKDSGSYLHRHAAEKKLDRRLRSGEVVHHINRNKSDNRWSNLWVFRDQKEHDITHKEDALLFGKEASYKGFKKKKWKFW